MEHKTKPASLDTLNRVDEEDVFETVDVTIDGLWWEDEKRSRTGKVDITVYYNPNQWYIYPDALLQFMREEGRSEQMRPEEMVSTLWNELASILYNTPDYAEGNLRVTGDVTCSADEYTITRGTLDNE